MCTSSSKKQRFLSEEPFLTPGIPPLERQMMLMQLILARQDLSLAPNQAFRLAGDLGRFLDASHTQKINLDKLQTLVPGELAAHWQTTLDFLKIITAVWPEILKQRQALDPAERRDLVLSKKAEALRRQQPAKRIIAAGSTGSIPATAELISVIARLPNGAVILPSFDPAIDEATWEAIDPTHHHYTMKQLIQTMDIDRALIKPWEGTDLQSSISLEYSKYRKTRKKIIDYALQPQKIFDLSNAHIDLDDIGPLTILQANTPQHEARTIAFLVRQIIEHPEKTIMIVTPDRLLAQKIIHECQRWKIEINDSGGSSLNQDPLGIFLRLIAEWPGSTTPATHLLSILRHPLTSLGKSRSDLFSSIGRIDLKLRGLYPIAGLTHVIESIDDEKTRQLMTEMKRLFDILNVNEKSLKQWLTDHLICAETISNASDKIGAEILWQDESGEKAALLFNALINDPESERLYLSGNDYAAFINSAMEQITVYPRYGLHPRIRLLSPIEARLQHADTVILGGMNDGIWPKEPDPDPWLSRPMQKEMQFSPPEKRLGQSAHDFISHFATADLFITFSSMRDGIQDQPSRWLQQIFAVLEKNKISEDYRTHPALDWAERWSNPDKIEARPAPEINPPLAMRPAHISVTDVQKWQNDPYSFYAKRILRLYPLDLLDKPLQASDWGNAAHELCERYFKEKFYKKSVTEKEDLVKNILSELPLDSNNYKRWFLRLKQLLSWLAEHDIQSDTIFYTEETGQIILDYPRPVTLTGRADRIDQQDNSLTIIDYKTGSLPSKNAVNTGYAPQLPLLGLIASCGGFKSIQAKEVKEIAYIHLKGKLQDIAQKTSFPDPQQAVQATREKLDDLVNTYLIEQMPFIAKIIPNKDHDDYALLKRPQEWAFITQEEAENDNNEE